MMRQVCLYWAGVFGCALVTWTASAEQPPASRPGSSSVPLNHAAVPPQADAAAGPAGGESSSAGGVAGGDASEPVTTPSTTEPNHVVVVRFSQQLFDRVKRPIDRVTPVRRQILGTDIHGVAHTHGQVTVTMDSNPRGASLLVHFRGAMHSTTTGYNGPAAIHSDGTTQFHAVKRVIFDMNGGFRSGPYAIRCTTRSRTRGINVNRRGILGCIIHRIAWRRVNASRAEADHIANRMAERDIGQQFSATLDERLAELNRRDNIPLLIASLLGKAIPGEASLDTTHNYLQLSFRREGTEAARARVPDHRVPGAPMEVWMHSSLIDKELPKTLRVYESLLEVVTGQPHVAALSRTLAPRRGPEPAKLDLSVADGWFVLGLSRTAEMDATASRRGARRSPGTSTPVRADR